LNVEAPHFAALGTCRSSRWASGHGKGLRIELQARAICATVECKQEAEWKARLVAKGSRGRPRGEPTALIRLPLPLANLARRLHERTLRAGEISRFLDIEPGEHRTIRLKGSRHYAEDHLR
jgi:hypothetical protein